MTAMESLPRLKTCSAVSVLVITWMSTGAVVSQEPAQSRVGQSQVAGALVAAEQAASQVAIAEATREKPFEADPRTSSSRIPLQLASYPSPDAETSPLSTPEMVRWVETLVRANLPPTYEDDRKWGKQKEVWDGIKWRREGWKLETKRRKKMVNSGTWTKYSIRIVEPEKQLYIQFHRLETLPDGRIAFGLTVDCALDVFGRLSQWARDVQLISISANADAACRLSIDGTVKVQLNPLKLPPDVSIRPEVDKAHVDLVYYRVRRISQVGGDFAKVLGNGLRGVVDDKLENMNGKLVEKINRQLEKQEDKLSFSAQDWLRSKLPLPAADPKSEATPAKSF